MTVDFEKLHKLLMPTFTRLPKMTALLIAIATPFQNLFASFQSWQADIRLQAATTCQVMYLENILNYRLFGSFTPQITITDGDGITVDFIVNIPAGVTVNGQLLIGLLEQYKLKGKRYNVVQSTRQYSVVWSDPVCELEQVQFSVAWSNPVCELQEVQTQIQNTITGIAPDKTSVRASAAFAVTSTLTVELQVLFLDGTFNDVIVTIANGSTESNSTDPQAPDKYMEGISAITVLSVSPASDSTYNYSINPTNLT